MKAHFLIKHGSPEQAFELRETPKPEAKKGEVVIKSEGFGLNYADVMARQGFYPPAPKPPGILGYDVVGKIESVGEGVPSDMIGKRVCALTRFGGYGEYVATQAIACIEINDEIPLGKALALSTQYCTAHYAFSRAANVQDGETILMHAGAGGVGIALAQLGMAKNCRIISMAGSDEKLDFLRSLGLEHVINYRTEDYFQKVKSIVGEDGVDVAFNSVAGKSFKQDLNLLSAGGRIALYGAATLSGSKIVFLSAIKMMLQMGLIMPLGLVSKSKSIIGINMLELGDQQPQKFKKIFEEVRDLYYDGVIDPVVYKEYSGDELVLAHSELTDRKTIGKLAVRWD